MSYEMTDNEYGMMRSNARAITAKIKESMKTIDELMDTAIKESVSLDTIKGLDPKSIEMAKAALRAYNEFKDVLSDTAEVQADMVRALTDIHADLTDVKADLKRLREKENEAKLDEI